VTETEIKCQVREWGFLVGLIKKREEVLPLFIVVGAWGFSGEREGGGGPYC
jgi:hypothetical protein